MMKLVPMATLSLLAATALVSCADNDEPPQGAVVSARSDDINAPFDLVTTHVSVDGSEIVFRSSVDAAAGSEKPAAVGDLDGAPVWSYVFPTTLDSSSVGFDAEQGILALAATAHPDFDDTPLYDENGDGDNANDGAHWHTHWVVLADDPSCAGGLAVKGIEDGSHPTLPSTWPELPILIDSPDLAAEFDDDAVEIRVPVADIGAPADFSYDGVTAGLRVSTAIGDSLLCVEAVFDVASGDLSLPGSVES